MHKQRRSTKSHKQTLTKVLPTRAGNDFWGKPDWTFAEILTVHYEAIKRTATVRKALSPATKKANLRLVEDAMLSLLHKVGPPAILLYLFVVVTQFLTGVYVAIGIEPPSLFQILNRLGFLWIIGWWLWNDSKKRQIPWVYDTGFFLYLVWPFFLPYHLLKSRGAKGLLSIGAFILVYIVAAVAGFALYILLAPSGWPSAF